MVVGILKILKKRDEYNIKVIMDWKSLSSGMSNEMLPSNLEKLTKDDELKFVIGDWEDYNDMKRTIRKYNPKCKVLISTIWDTIERNEVVEQMLKDNIEARFQIQMHKIIWDKDKRGV